MDYFKKVDMNGNTYHVKDEEARESISDLIDMIVAGTVTTALLTEDGQALLTEDGESLLLARHVG